MHNDIPGPVIGVDEAGRGPVIGPLVVAAVLTEDQDLLKEMGVRDSKQLTPGRRQELARAIRRTCTVETTQITAAEIDSLRKKITLNEIEVNAFCQVVRKFLIDRRNDYDLTIILDAADVNEDRFGRDVEAKLLIRIGSIPNVISRHKADDIFPAVSAASIIAKVIRDNEIEALKEKYGEIGSGYPSDPVTRRHLYRLFKNGKEMPSYVRKSWKTVTKIREEMCKTSLDDFF